MAMSPASTIKASSAVSWRSLFPEVAFCLAALPVLIIREYGPLIEVSASRSRESSNWAKSRESAVIDDPPSVHHDRITEPLVVSTLEAEPSTPGKV